MATDDIKGVTVGYARVSTQGQDLSDQIETLKKAGCTKIFAEKYTGTTLKRTQFQKMMNFVREGDTLVVTKLDRLARNAIDVSKITQQLYKKGVHVKFLNLPSFTNDENGKLLLQILAAFAEFERDMIVTRMTEGKRYAKEHDPSFKEGRPRIPQDRLLSAYKLHDNLGQSWRSVARTTGISVATLVNRHKQWQLAQEVKN